MTSSVQAIDFSRYLPPGVYTEAVPGPQIAVNSSMPTAVALIGTTVGYKTHTESIQINPDLSITLPAVNNKTLDKKGIKLPLTPRVTVTANIDIFKPGATQGGVTLALNDLILLAGQTKSKENGYYLWKGATNTLLPAPQSFTVISVNDGTVYNQGSDYTIVRVSPGADVLVNTRDDTYTISRIVGGRIAQGEIVQVSYQYTEKDYFAPTVFYDYDDVRGQYGEPFSTVTGQVISELTLAAKFAFLNGAFQVIGVAVDAAIPGNPTVGEYVDALEKLEDQALVSLIVPCTGMYELHQKVSEHINAQSALRFERRAILGRDGTVGTVSSATRITNAQSITNQRVLLVSPATFKYYSPEINNSVNLGGQFMAASLAGQTIRRSAAQPLTHKNIAGWTDVVDTQTEGEKNLETQSGLCVVEKTRRQLIRVRHGVTTDPTDLLSREWSIIGQQDAMTYRVRDYLENANLIGQPIFPYTLVNVKSSAEAALQSLIRDGLLVDYVGLKVRQLLTNPDVIEISYSWLPAFPLNYIVVRFGVSLTSGDITVQGGTGSTTNFTSATQVTSAIGAPAATLTNDFGGTSNTLRST
jgi:hypothetical protein